MNVRALFVRLITAVLMVTLAGCIVAPIPSPTRRVGPAGKIKELDFKSFAAGKTTRDNMAKQLSAVDTGVKLRNGYWARWEKSKWTWVAAVGGPGAAAGGGSRFWSAENLIAEFDDNGVLKNWHVVRDAALAAELNRFIVAGTRWQGDERVEYDVVHQHRKVAGEGAMLALHRDYLELSEPGKHKAHSFKLGPDQIIGVTTRNIDHDTDDINIQIIRVALKFAKPTAVGNELKIKTSPEHLVDLMSYVRERAPKAEIK